MAYKKYTVAKGDTLSKIAQRHDMTWRELYNFDGGTGTPNRSRLRSNDPNLIYPGEVILVPDSSPKPAKPVPAKPGKNGGSGNVYVPKSNGTSPAASGTRTLSVVEVVVHDGKEYTEKPDSSRRQYVNRDDDDVVEYGRRIRLKACYVEKTGTQTKLLSGEKIYWRAYPGPNNKKGLIKQLKAGFDSAGSGTLEKEVTTDADGWTPIVDFYVSRYGGDVFHLMASDRKPPKNASSSYGEAAGTYEVWRKLYYELDCMTRPGGGGTYANRANTTGMENKLAQSFVEVQKEGSDDSPAHQRVLRTGEAQNWTKNIRQGAFWHRKKLYYHLVLVDTIVSGSKNVTLTHNLNAGVNTIKIPGSQYDLDPRDWFIDAEFWQPHMGNTITGSKDYTDLDKDNFTLTEGGNVASKTDHYLLTIDFPEGGFFEEGYKASEKSVVRLKIKTWNGLSGVQVGPATVIGMRWRERGYSGTQLVNRTLNTMVHEPGHAMGLAATTLPDGSPCGTTYVKNGHHCNNNSNKCVMYEANSKHTDLCNNCTDALRGRDLSALPISGNKSYV